MELNIIDHDKCTLCELCIEDCVRQNIWLADDIIKVSDNCNQCGHCKAVCPEDAIEIPGLEPTEFEPMPEKEAVPNPDQLMAFFRMRRSTRLYKREVVEKDKLAQIVEAGRFAPTGGNRQSLQYAVVQSLEVMGKVRDLTLNILAEQGRAMAEGLKSKQERGEAFSPTDEAMQRYSISWQNMAQMNQEGTDRLFYHAPNLVVIHADPAESPGPEIDAGLAAMQMALMAESLGLGTCYIGFLVMALGISPELKQMMQIPEANNTPVTFVTGYPDITYERLVARNPARVSWV